MIKTSEIFVFVHRNYNRVLQMGGLGYDNLKEESYYHYNAVKREQEILVGTILRDPAKVLFYVPSFFLDEKTYTSLWNYLPDQEQNILLHEMDYVWELANALSDRFCLARGKYFSTQTTRRWLKPTEEFMFDSSRITNIKPRRDAKVFAFGEFTHNCVQKYGLGVCRGLGISESRFSIISKASIDDVELEQDFLNPAYEQDHRFNLFEAKLHKRGVEYVE